jgi:acyl-CoA reductase-like NAD-dependent aldehyde dehydrogenase
MSDLATGSIASEVAAPLGIKVCSPATGEPIGEVPARGPEAVAAVAAMARAAQPAWAALGVERRSGVLRDVQRRIIADADRIVDVISSETGKTRDDASNMEISYIALALDFWRRNAARFLADERVRSRALMALGKRLAVRYEPVGLVGVIGPWNYPLANAFGDCIPALMAGNSVILKPASATPLASLIIAELVHASGVPVGVFQVLTGQGATAEVLIDEADMIMFTGSTETGKRVMARAAESLTPMSLALGGKDAMIVLADADLDRAANVAVQYGFCNAGQTCLAIERVYVEAGVHDKFAELVSEKVEALRHGPPGPLGTVDVGSLTTTDQAELVAEHVEDAVTKGARVLVGGTRDGNFYPPTVLIGVDHGMRCMIEETFGPTLPIMQVADADEALRLANDSPFGLAGCVFGRDAIRAEALARRLEAGTVSVNDAVSHYGILDLPMGGWKSSGIGSRHGAEGIRKYCRRQSVLVSTLSARRELHFYPNRAWASRLMRKALEVLYGRVGGPTTTARKPRGKA